MKPCERCTEFPAIDGECFCQKCRKIVMAEMKESGYLQWVPTFHIGSGRTADMREAINDTKHGADR